MSKNLHNLLVVLASKGKDGDKDKKILSKSEAAKKSEKGEDLGKKGKNFDKIADKAGKEYGSKEAGKKVAGSIFQKQRKAGDL